MQKHPAGFDGPCVDRSPREVLRGDGLRRRPIGGTRTIDEGRQHVKNILALVVLMGMLGLAVPQAYPQQPGVSRPIVSDLHHVWYCSYYDSISLDNLARFHYLGFSDNAPAEQVTEEVIQAVGIPVTSIAVRPGNVPNAVALVDGTVRVIVYNPGFLHGARTQSGTNWAVYCVMAHEIGHHLSGHTLEPGGSRPDKELEADRFSGHVLFFLNATVDQAMSALQSLPDGGGSATHPPKRDRLQAVVAGWNEAKRRSNGQRNKVTTPLPRELFASNLGVYYTPVPYSDGTFGAGLTRPPAAGSPASRTGLEPGDVIVALDEMPLRDPGDFLRHAGRIRMTLIDHRTGRRLSEDLFLGTPVPPPPIDRPSVTPPGPADGRDGDEPPPVPDVAPPGLVVPPGPVGP
jgi:Peptidase family M48